MPALHHFVTGAGCFHFALESRPELPHPAGLMRLFTILAAALCLTATVIQSRAAETNTIPLIIGAAQAATNIGQQVTITGVVAQVSFRPTLVFLNFDKRYPDSPFTAIVRNTYTNEFEQLSTLKGKSVSVNGTVIKYNGKPEIELTNKAQLKTLGGTK
jgi:DNA/RNA endonuclease YhcR with UshA esterase domain